MLPFASEDRCAKEATVRVIDWNRHEVEIRVRIIRSATTIEGSMRVGPFDNKGDAELWSSKFSADFAAYFDPSTFIDPFEGKMTETEIVDGVEVEVPIEPEPLPQIQLLGCVHRILEYRIAKILRLDAIMHNPRKKTNLQILEILPEKICEDAVGFILMEVEACHEPPEI